MSKKERGIHFVAVPRLGIHTRDDLDHLCRHEMVEAHNTYLALRSSHDQSGPGAELELVAVNPDGERRAQHQLLCFWYPEAAANELVSHFKNSRLGEDEFRMDVRYWEERKRAFREGALELWKLHRAQARQRKEKAEAEYNRQQEHYRRLLEGEC